MGNLVIATPVLSDAATLTAGSAASSMPVTNLQTTQPGEVWRATDLTQAFVVVDLGSAKVVNLVWLGYTNGSIDATVRVRAANSLAGLTASPGFDQVHNLWPDLGLSGWDWMHHFLWAGTGAVIGTYRYWRLDISDPTNPDGFFQAGRLYLAWAWQPTRNMRYGWAMQWTGDGPKDRAVGNQLYALQAPRFRVADLTLGFTTEAEMYANGFELDRLRGTSKDWLFIRDPNGSYLMQQSIYGQSIEMSPIIHQALNIFEKRFRIEEMLP